MNGYIAGIMQAEERELQDFLDQNNKMSEKELDLLIEEKLEEYEFWKGQEKTNNERTADASSFFSMCGYTSKVEAVPKQESRSILVARFTNREEKIDFLTKLYKEISEMVIADAYHMLWLITF